LDAFLKQVPGRLATLEAAAESGNADAITRAAHVLRGAAATIGAGQLAGLLQHVETAAQDGDVGQARGDLARVLSEAAAVLAYVRRDRPGDDAPPAVRS
jgi:HPt (histidine-containing phosphotransfer) domain-containing protein